MSHNVTSQKSEDAKLTTLLAASIAREQNKQRKDETKDQYLVRLQKNESCLRRFVHLQLLGFESNFNEDHQYSYEELDEYLDCAKFMRDNYKRDHHIIVAVESKKLSMSTQTKRDNNLLDYFRITF